MSRALLLPAALLLLGCQRQTEPQLSRLQNQLQAQQDTLRLLRQELGARQHLPDSLQLLQGQLSRTQQQLEEAAMMANALSPTGSAPAGRQKPLKPVPAGTLYGRPALVTLPDEEMAEVLNLADTTSSSGGADYDVKAYRVCNGPADATLDFCNCSHYVYLALGSGADMPYTYKLYRLGPFYEARLAGWAKAGAGEAEQAVLRIRHDVKGRNQTDSFRISWQGVRQL